MIQGPRHRRSLASLSLRSWPTSTKMDEPSCSAESTLLMDDKCVNEARSTTPIPPALPPRPDKRALLLIYIHGFKGNETSFIEFPTVWSQKYNANKTRISKSRYARN